MDIGAYIHVPFCRSRCSYCDFNTYAGLGDLIEPYVAALVAQIGQTRVLREPDRAVVRTIYFGGGTPSMLSPELADRVLSAIRGSFVVSPGAEVSMEANPGTVDLTYLRDIRALGVNRVSLGVQCLDDATLAALGRIHTAEEAREAVRLARRAGFDNLSLDLMYGLPAQNLAQWKHTLSEAIALRPEHLSLYALTLDDETPLGKAVAAGEVSVPEDDAAADMYEAAEDLLDAAGYSHYEISNWSLAGRQCSHNLIYWRNEPYLGFGAGAHSSLPLPAVSQSWLGQAPEPEAQWVRFGSVREPDRFIAAGQLGRPVTEDLEMLPVPKSMAETMFLGLRLVQEGVPFSSFSGRFRQDARAVYQRQFSELESDALITVDEARVCLTRRGRLLGNEVFQRFLE
jgi:oxygen-independent coproporphyrinogen III oxidase